MFPIFLMIEDGKLLRIVLAKSDRSAANCWRSLLEGQYESDSWVFSEMEKKMTLERFQREVSSCSDISLCLLNL